MFSDSLGYDEKIDALHDEFKISVSREMDKGVLSMCNLSMGVYNKGKMEMAYELYGMGIPVEKIASAAKVSIETLKEWLANREEMLVK